MEIHAEVLLKATKVDGVYDKDPKMFEQRGARYTKLTYLDVLARGLNVMDSTAISLCKENSLPILVFNMLVRNNIRGWCAASRSVHSCAPTASASSRAR
jgi:uridylate kinase